MNEVGPDDGGTLFFTGSHKSNYPMPDVSIDDPLFDSYACPAGSMLFFTEYLWHPGAPWTCKDRDRVVVFNHYTDFLIKIHYGMPTHEEVMAMPPKRRTLFRGVWHTDFPGGPPLYNVAYGEDNRAI